MAIREAQSRSASPFSIRLAQDLRAPLRVYELRGLVSRIVYLIYGQPVFGDTAGTATLSVGYLMGFAFVRSFPLLAILVVLTSFGVR